MNNWLRKDGEALTVWWQWLKGRRERPISTSVVVILFVSLLWILWQTVQADRTGFGSRSLWDWLDLLFIPGVLALGVFWLNKRQRNAERERDEKNQENDRKRTEQQAELEREIAREQREQETLHQYLDRMTDLLLNHSLHQDGDEEVSEGSLQARNVAKARTRTVLESLDGDRRAVVIRYLYNAGLIDWRNDQKAVIQLGYSNLEGVRLVAEPLHRVYLANVNLSEAKLDDAILDAAILEGANLKRASLRAASLVSAKLSHAVLEEANFEYADMSAAEIRWANLRGAKALGVFLSGAKLIVSDLYGANLRDAHLGYADLRLANLSSTDLRGADLSESNLEGADLTHAQLQNAFLWETKLVNAKYSTHTQWPEGFDPKAAGAILVDENGHAVKQA